MEELVCVHLWSKCAAGRHTTKEMRQTSADLNETNWNEMNSFCYFFSFILLCTILPRNLLLCESLAFMRTFAVGVHFNCPVGQDVQILFVERRSRLWMPSPRSISDAYVSAEALQHVATGGKMFIGRWKLIYAVINENTAPRELANSCAERSDVGNMLHSSKCAKLFHLSGLLTTLLRTRYLQSAKVVDEFKVESIAFGF